MDQRRRNEALLTVLTCVRYHGSMSTDITVLFQEVGTLGNVPDEALEFGFANGTECPHSSRTISLVPLQQLLEYVSARARHDDYRSAVVDENVLHKATQSSRQKTFGFLASFYALSPDILLFRALRDLWDTDMLAQPLIALMCAMARDPVFRSTADVVLGLHQGEALMPVQISGPIVEHFPGRFNEKTAKSLGQNIASSWQQSGHLAGRKKKTRAQANCRPAAVA